MISAKDISNKRFEKAAFGYKQEEVDDFLRELVSDLTMIQKERDDTSSKIQILADKVREYRQDEEALKDALLGAQKQGHKVVAEAQEKARAIIDDAQGRADVIIEEANEKYEQAVIKNQAQIDREKEVLMKTQKEVTEFKKTLFDMYKNHLEMISAIPEMDDDEYEEAVSRENSKMVSEEEPEDDYEEEDDTPAPDPFATSAFPAQRFNAANSGNFESRFGELKFGQNNK